MFFMFVFFILLIVVPALDHRFHWSDVPSSVVIFGDILVVIGYVVVFFVFRENSFAAATIEVVEDQKVVSTGSYALVRHPMYVGGLVMLLGVPLALGSWWGLLIFIPIAALLAWRILDEERFLSKNLPGYSEYAQRDRYRLAPNIW